MLAKLNGKGSSKFSGAGLPIGNWDYKQGGSRPFAFIDCSPQLFRTVVRIIYLIGILIGTSSFFDWLILGGSLIISLLWSV